MNNAGGFMENFTEKEKKPMDDGLLTNGTYGRNFA